MSKEWHERFVLILLYQHNGIEYLPPVVQERVKEIRKQMYEMAYEHGAELAKLYDEEIYKDA